MNAKLVYLDLSLNGFDLERAVKLKGDALETIIKILEKLALYNAVGEQVKVTIKLNEFVDPRFDEEKIFRNARATRSSSKEYQIEIGLGLLAQISLVAKGLAADENGLRARRRSKLLQKKARMDGREKLLGDFTFHFMLTFFLWHEVAHIALGHLDWLNKNAKLNAIEEFGQNELFRASNEIYRTLEGDADRQATTWAASIIDYGLESNPYLQYQSLSDVFYDMGYLYGALFMLLDSVDADTPAEKRKHPNADVRLGIALAFVNSYLEKYHADSKNILMQQVYAGGMDARKKIFHLNKTDFDLLGVAAFIAENGTRIENMGLRVMQHKLSKSENSSFIFS